MEILPLLTSFSEIVIIAISINYFLSMFWNTKTMDIIWGITVFIVFLIATNFLNLPVLHKIMVILGNVIAMGLVIIFQPEIRSAFSRLSIKGKKNKEITEFDRFLDQLANTIYRMAEKRIGALILLENEDSLEEYAQKAVTLNANFSPELLETIFVSSTPLHDGAVIMRGKIILAAASILPLAEDSSQLAKSMGTRHRAALGISHITDSVVIVVSEESGKISIARDGIMTKGIKIDRLKGIIRSVFSAPEKLEFQRRFKIKEWLNQ